MKYYEAVKIIAQKDLLKWNSLRRKKEKLKKNRQPWVVLWEKI